jgi:hypothetical protein
MGPTPASWAPAPGTWAPGAPAPEARSASRVKLTGSAQAVKQRTESRRKLPTEQILTFRLERYGASGDRLPPVAVEMRGLTLTGGISDGERVEVEGRFRGGVLYAKRVHSLTTGGKASASVFAHLELRLGRRGAITALIVLVVLALVACRFIPQIYYNTPFGKKEYRADVVATCTRITAEKNEPLPPPHMNVGSTFTGNPDDMLIYDRDEIAATVRNREADIVEEYELLLGRTTPLSLRSRRQNVVDLLAQLQVLYATSDRVLSGMPAQYTQAQLEKATEPYESRTAILQTKLSAAMTAQAGATCAG